jgi:hypothetical protein
VDQAIRTWILRTEKSEGMGVDKLYGVKSFYWQPELETADNPKAVCAGL